MKQIDELRQEAIEKISNVDNLSELNELRVSFLGKKGPVQGLMKLMKNLPKEEKP